MNTTVTESAAIPKLPHRAVGSPRKKHGLHTSLSVEERRMLVSDRPITFEQWTDRGGKDLYELVRGTLVEKMAASIEHEWLFSWLFQLLGVYVQHKDLGRVLGSRTGVRITEFDGRLPDILFIRKDRMNIARPKGIYAEPDLIVEIRSPGDRPSEVNALEAEYRTIGVQEIWLIDPKRRRVRTLVRANGEYREFELSSGELRSEVIDSFSLQVEWLWNDDRPDVFGLLQSMLEQP